MIVKKKNIYKVIRYIILILLTAITLIPFLTLPIVSLKTKQEYLTDPMALPSSLSLANYIEVFHRANILKAFSNSLILMVGALALEIVLGALTAYALTKMQFKHAGTFSGIFLAPMIFPVQSITVPLYLIFKSIGLTNSYVGMILLEAALGLPMTIFMMTSFMKTIPIQISESATIDGAGHGTILFKLIVPLLKPVISTLAVVCGITIWNAFYVPMIMLTKQSMRTLPLTIYDFMGMYENDWTLLSACIIFVILPIIIMYVFLQKNIINGVTTGAVKG